MDTKALRQKILDLAIRGKLVPQDSNDEPASVLLERIREEKKQMVKEGKLKPKDIKNDTIIFKGEDNLHYEKFQDGTVKCIEEEIPFEVPEGWELCRLNDVISLMTDYVANGSFKTLRENVTTYKEPNYALFIRTVDFSNDFKGDLSYIDKESYEFLSKSQLHGGELMLSNIGASIGKIFRIPHFDMPMSLAPNSIIVKFHDEETYDYFECMFKSFVGQDFLLKLTAGTAMPKFSKTELKQMVVPIAPLKEQVRISNECKKLLSVVDSMESNKEDLAEIIALAKSKILDLAIQGKLVPQDSNDEPASVLLDRIRSEKEELIKQGKLKRDKKESIIYKGDDNSYYEKFLDGSSKCIDDDLPFSLPDNWEWCNLSMIGNSNIGLTYKPENISNDGTIVLRSSNIINGKIDYSDIVRVNSKIKDNQYAEENDILICARNGSKSLVGKCALIPKINDKMSFGAFMAIYRTPFYRYVYLFLNSKEFKKVFDDSNSTAINQLTQAMLKRTVLPLPPIQEQIKICNTVQELFNLIENIEDSLN